MNAQITNPAQNNDSPILKEQDAPAEVILVDPITLPIAKVLASLKVHPLVITFFAFMFRLGGAALFAFNRLELGAICSIIGFYLDGIDGKVARIRHLDEELHGTMDFMLDQVAFGFMGIGAVSWAVHYDHSLSAVLIGSWLAFYMIFMSFTSTWFRILSQNGLVYKTGIHKDFFEEAIDTGKGGFIRSTLLNLASLFTASKNKLAKFRMMPYFGGIESEILIFMVAPFFKFNPALVLISVIFLLPDTIIMFTLCTLRVTKHR